MHNFYFFLTFQPAKKKVKLNTGAAAEAAEAEDLENFKTISTDGVSTLQNACEQRIATTLASSLECAIHAGRLTIMPKDIQIYRRLTLDF